MINIDNFTIRHLTTQSTSTSIVQRMREVSLVSDIIKPGIQGIFYAAGGAFFTYAYGFLTQQKSYKDGHMEGYNKGYSEGFIKVITKDLTRLP